eukprot:COSAG06_NODE_67166_length_252_cov_1.333333_2_plen_24_part_01
MRLDLGIPMRGYCRWTVLLVLVLL